MYLRAHLSLLTALFALTAFILLLVTVLQCNFAKFIDADDADVVREFGIYYYQAFSTVLTNEGTYIVKACVEYPASVELDSSWKASRAFLVLAFILAVMILLFKLVLGCSSQPEKKGYTGLGKFVPLGYLLTAIFQGLSLLFLNSNACKNNNLISMEDQTIDWNDTCTISTGAKCFISATVVWFCAAISSYFEQKAFINEHRIEVTDASLTESLTVNNEAGTTV